MHKRAKWYEALSTERDIDHTALCAQEPTNITIVLSAKEPQRIFGALSANDTKPLHCFLFGSFRTRDKEYEDRRAKVNIWRVPPT